MIEPKDYFKNALLIAMLGCAVLVLIGFIGSAQ
jgi:hypothetical protein